MLQTKDTDFQNVLKKKKARPEYMLPMILTIDLKTNTVSLESVIESEMM